MESADNNNKSVYYNWDKHVVVFP